MIYATSIIAELKYLAKTYKTHPELSGDPGPVFDLLVAAGRHATAGRISAAEFERIVDALDQLSLTLENDDGQDLRSR